MDYLLLTVQIVATEFMSDKTLSVSIALPHITPPQQAFQSCLI